MASSPPPILVVDDDEDTRELYVTAFEVAGFAVRAAASVAEARALLDESAPEVLIGDYSLPDGTGPALLQLCVAAARPRLCVLVTGFGEAEEKVAASGFDLVLTKPVDLEKLISAVRDKLAR